MGTKHIEKTLEQVTNNNFDFQTNISMNAWESLMRGEAISWSFYMHVS